MFGGNGLWISFGITLTLKSSLLMYFIRSNFPVSYWRLSHNSTFHFVRSHHWTWFIWNNSFAQKCAQIFRGVWNDRFWLKISIDLFPATTSALASIRGINISESLLMLRPILFKIQIWFFPQHINWFSCIIYTIYIDLLLKRTRI